MTVKHCIVPALTLAAAIAFTAGGAGAYAGTAKADSIASTTVNFADLNLNSRAGARILLRRIKKAASEVCGGEPARYSLAQISHYRTCVRDATDRAVVDLDAATVTALHYNEVDGGPTGFEEASSLGD